MATTKKKTKTKTKATGDGTKKKKTRKKKATGPDPAEIWQQLSDQLGTERIEKYTMVKQFPVHIALDHPKFGTGFIIMSLPNKIQVVFKDGSRALVHNRKI